MTFQKNISSGFPLLMRILKPSCLQSLMMKKKLRIGFIRILLSALAVCARNGRRLKPYE